MARTKPLSEAEFHSIYSKVPRLTVDLTVIDPKGLVLTLREKHGWVGQWHLPGGTVHMNESVVDSINRIAMEELGIKVQIKKFVGYIEYHSEEAERGYGYSVSLAFYCSPLTQSYRTDGEVSKLEFFKDLPANTITEQKIFLQKYLDRLGM